MYAYIHTYIRIHQIMSVRSAALELESEELFQGQHLHVYFTSNEELRLVAFLEVCLCVSVCLCVYFTANEE